MVIYNTIMSVAAGSGLLLIVFFAWGLFKHPRSLPGDGFALAFAGTGLLLTITGSHMTLTWPLTRPLHFDNIIFGEPALAFGVMLLGAAVYLWTRGSSVLQGDDPVGRLAVEARPISIFVCGIGLGLFGIAAAGIRYQLFVAPPQEPISGAFADYPLVEATFISTLYALVGVGAVLFPLSLWPARALSAKRPVVQIIGATWTLAGLVFLAFGALNYFTHIGLLVNTS